MDNPNEYCMAHLKKLDEVEFKVHILGNEVEILKRAFPDGPENHRRAHEDMIAASLADKVFMRELKLDAAKKGLWLLILVSAGVFLIGLQIKIKQFLGL